jgi:hypothetical protein
MRVVSHAADLPFAVGVARASIALAHGA